MPVPLLTYVTWASFSTYSLNDTTIAIDRLINGHVMIDIQSALFLF